MRFAALVLAVMGFSLLVLPRIYPRDPMLTRPELQMQPPTPEHPFGTDTLGRDILARVLHGGQRTLATAGLATITAVIPGAGFGIIAGWSRGRLDRLTLATMNAMIAFPGLLLALVIVTLVGRGFLSIGLAVGLSQVVPFALLVRSTTRELRSTLYVEAACAAGATRWRVTLYHVLPNAAPTLGAFAGVVFAYAVLNGAALGFLGLGGQPGEPELGVMLAEARPAWRLAPWQGLAPGLAITLTVMSVNKLIGQATRTRH